MPVSLTPSKTILPPDVYKRQLEAHAGDIAQLVIENDCRNSAIPMLDLKPINARIEPGAIIRENVEIGDNAVIMMGAIINIGAIIGAGTMICLLYTSKEKATIPAAPL